MSTAAMKADTVIRNANVITMYSSRPGMEAVISIQPLPVHLLYGPTADLQ